MRIDVALHEPQLHAQLAQLQHRLDAVVRDARPVACGLPGFAVHCRELAGEFHVYVVDARSGALAGCTVFARCAPGGPAGPLWSPHSKYAGAYRGRGLATAVYRWALAAGLCLLSGPRQSPAAHRLWLRLGQEAGGLAVVRLGPAGLQLLDGVQQADDDLATRLLLVGAGWTVGEVAALRPQRPPAGVRAAPTGPARTAPARLAPSGSAAGPHPGPPRR